MTSKVVVKTSSGISFFSALALLFIGLKLGGIITWSWFWVLSPLFLPLLVVLSLAFLLGVASVFIRS